MIRAVIGWMALALACAVATTPIRAADMSKTIHVAFGSAENGLDPQAVYDSYSFYVCHAIFDPLYTYDYFARPVRLVPNTAAGLPQITDGGRTFTVKVRPGIYFAEDPAFKGKKRELTAEDYVFTIKRIFDPKVRSYWLYLFDHRLVGLDEALERARKDNGFDYDQKIEGLQALDRYTLQVKLKEPDYLLIERMTTVPMAAVAREIVEAYGTPQNGWTMDHPVGTGPFTLKEWRRGSKVVLAANPAYRDERFPSAFAASDSAAVRANAGKRLPLVGQVEINVMEEGNPRLLALSGRQIEYLWVPYNLVDRVLENGALKAEYARQNLQWTRVLETAFTYTYFNMDDPLVGGYSQERVALRRAIAMGYDVADEIRILRQGQAIPATQLVPPGLLGHDPTRSRAGEYNPAAAQALLDKFGYKRVGPGGYRSRPDGSPLVLKLGSSPSSEDREFDELWKRSMDAIGIRIEFIKQKWPDLLKMSTAGQLQMFRLARFTTLRDGGGLFEILYSKNIGTGMNDSHFNLPEFDRLFEQSRALPDGPERNALYAKLAEITGAYMPLMLGTYRYRTVLAQPWVLGLRPDPFFREPWKYLDIDMERRKAGR